MQIRQQLARNYEYQHPQMGNSYRQNRVCRFAPTGGVFVAMLAVSAH